MIQNNYSPAFCGIPVTKINITKIVNEKSYPIETTIEKISKMCPEDFNTIKKIIPEWSKRGSKTLLQSFYDSFIKPTGKSSFFWLKTADNDIAGILATTDPNSQLFKRVFQIKYLISKPAECDNSIRYKGAGKAGLLQAVKMAKENKFKLIQLFSSLQAVSFYKKMGFTKNRNLTELDCFELSSKHFNSFIKKNEI